ncbi:MAG: PIN domain-containing protein [Acidobacteriota bacterium]|nr:PIN domain-containing protein [Acidobacteriota bacterium]
MSVAYLDTHVAVFLHAGAVEELSREAARQIESNDLLVSPMVFLELEYLRERRAINADARTILADLSTDFGVALCQISLARVARESIDLDWVRDPFDRLIVANARANGNAVLITRDRLIRRHYPRSAW